MSAAHYNSVNSWPEVRFTSRIFNPYVHPEVHIVLATGTRAGERHLIFIFLLFPLGHRRGILMSEPCFPRGTRPHTSWSSNSLPLLLLLLLLSAVMVGGRP
jgi:hypothetical protein